MKGIEVMTSKISKENLDALIIRKQQLIDEVQSLRFPRAAWIKKQGILIQAITRKINEYYTEV